MKRIIALTCVVFHLIFGFDSFAQMPSKNQIEKFKRLPPEQQKALAKSMGINPEDYNEFVTESPSTQTAPQPDPISSKRELPEEAKPIQSNENEIEDTAEEGTDEISLKEDEGHEATNEKLELFGYNLFEHGAEAFTPAKDIPIPANYVVGPGDTFIIQLYGKTNATYTLSIDRDGNVHFPSIGPVNLAGLKFSSTREKIDEIVSQQMIGVKSSVTMGPLRTIRIFVLGEVRIPGSYVVGSLSTMTNAIFASGGISKVGSLRNIQLKRDGDVVSQLDLYDLLLRGDTRNDARLLPGDVIFIPPIGKTASVSGPVRRPGVYELKNEKTVEELLELAGSHLATAYLPASRIERITPAGEKTIININPTTATGKKTRIEDADVLQIFETLDTMRDIVVLEGHVKRPGAFKWKRNMRFTDIVHSIDELLPNPDINFGIIRREEKKTRKIRVELFSPKEAFEKPNGTQNPLLESRDTIILFNYKNNRSEFFTELISDLEVQSDFNERELTVSIKGSVRFPGKYPLTKNMSTRDLIILAGGITQGNLGSDINIGVIQREEKHTRNLQVNLFSPKKTFKEKADNRNNPLLESKDSLIIFDYQSDRSILLEDAILRLKTQANFNEQPQVVRIDGSVRFPGEYPLSTNMSAHELIDLAGGLEESALKSDAEITRYEIDEQRRRVVMHLYANLDLENPVLSAGDTIRIKQIPLWSKKESVEISGEVLYPGKYAILPGETLIDVLQRAGGLSAHADPKGAVFSRAELRELEEERLIGLRDQIESDIAAESLIGEDGTIEEATLQIMENLENVTALGRMVIDLPSIMSKPQEYDFQLRDGDTLLVPRFKPSVTVVGEIQYPTSHFYDRKLTAFDYVERSGGLKRNSDRKRIYIVKANGRVFLPSSSAWFKSKSHSVEPGDTIVVPLDTDKVNKLEMWGSVTTIMYQAALGIAAIGAL